LINANTSKRLPRAYILDRDAIAADRPELAGEVLEENEGRLAGLDVGFFWTSLRSLPPGGLARMISTRSFSWMSFEVLG